MADQTIPRYGSVESYARILRRGKREFLESNALGIVQSIVDHPDDLDAVKVERVKNLLAAAWALDMEPADPTGLDYSRPADGDEPQQVGQRERLHTGAVTDEGLVDESEVVHISLVGNKTQCGLKVGDLPPGHSVVDSWSAPSTCKACGDEEPF